MSDASLTTTDPQQTARAGVLLGRLLEPGDVVALAGDLGAGKTTLTQGVAIGLGVEGPVVSPTFNILVVHRGRLALYHLDLYRLTRPEELDDIDFFGTLEAGGAAFIEWGDRFPEALPHDRLDVTLAFEGSEQRRIEAVGTGPRSAALAAAWVASWDRDAASRGLAGAGGGS